MQLFSLNIHYFVDVSFVLTSCLFPEQYLCENFVPILEQYCPMPMLKRHLVCSRHNQSAISRSELLTISNLFRAHNNEINFLNERL